MKLIKQYNTRNWQYYTNDRFFWGKAYILEGDAVMLQDPVLCKDYIVDTYYRTPLKALAKQRKECCFYMHLPEDKRELFYKNVKEFLHPWEIKHGYTPTTVTECTNQFEHLNNWQKPVVFQGDQDWCKNTYLLSLYLSLIRLCAYSTTMSEKEIYTTSTRCNEHSYLAKLTEKQRGVFFKLLNNPRYLELKSKTGYKRINLNKYKTHEGHGMFGIFFVLTNPGYYQEETNHLMYNHVHKLFQE